MIFFLQFLPRDSASSGAGLTESRMKTALKTSAKRLTRKTPAVANQITIESFQPIQLTIRNIKKFKVIQVHLFTFTVES